MTTQAKITVTAILLFVLAGLWGLDAYVSRSNWVATPPVSDQVAQQTGTGTSAAAVSSSSPSSAPSAMAAGVAKMSGPDVAAYLSSKGITLQATKDSTMLAQIASAPGTVRVQAMLLNNDRIGAIAWIDGPDVKTYFGTLKEALLSAFSPKLTGLKDETLREPGLPVRNILTFSDPALSSDTLAFVRVRERLYEFHITPGKETLVNPLIDELGTR